MASTLAAPSEQRATRVVDLIEQLTARLQAGEPVDIEGFLAEHPDNASEIRRLLPTLALLVDLSKSGPASAQGLDQAVGELGDFRLIREVGRGGMGVVYEAEQISLNRRVALKVLPFAATMDPRHLQRFKNEALAAASLEHPHIVPVYGVGCERGVHFYAMKFIDGRPLTDVIRPPSDASRSAQAGAETEPVARAATVPVPRDPGRFRRIAEWGIQAAEALEHAHSLGIVHRDIKPGNLLIDGQGKLWVTDFGLAKLANPGRETGEITMTGDVLGTLRYMSPEQALAKHGLVDHRTDVYSLGATLYELLTGKAAVPGDDKQEIFKRIAFEEPTPPRKLDKSIPAELETITLKALGKEPGERYATAGDLAEDLRRFLVNKPITAKPPTVPQRAAKWARRHPGLTAALSLTAGLLLAGAWAWDRDKSQAETAAKAVATEADELREQDRLPEALAVARRAADLLPRFGGDAMLRRAIEVQVADLQLANRLEEARLEQTAGRADGFFDLERAEPIFRQAFLDCGIDVIAGDEAAVFDALRRRSVVAQVSAAIYEWERIAADSATKVRLNRLAEALDADSHQFVSRMRRAEALSDLEALKQLAGEAQAVPPAPGVLVRLGLALKNANAVADAERLLRDGQRRYPADFWINFELACTLGSMVPKQPAEAVGFYRAALAIRPRSPGPYINLANIFMYQMGRQAESIEASRRAIELMPGHPASHCNLGILLRMAKRLQEAEVAFCRAIELAPTYFDAHYSLGQLLYEMGRTKESEIVFRGAVALKPDRAEAHGELGNVLCALGRHLEAETVLRRAIALKTDYALAYSNLGNALAGQGRHSEAEAAQRQAIALNPDFATAHNNRGNALIELGRYADAELSYRRAIELEPDYSNAFIGLGQVLIDLARYPEAEAAFLRAIALNSNLVAAHINLGIVFDRVGRRQDAEGALRRAIALQPESAVAHFNLGLLLESLGNYDDALLELRRAHELGANKNSPDPLRWVRRVEQLVVLKAKLPAVLSGKDKAADPTEQTALARICQVYKLYAAAAQFYADAFAVDPKLMEHSNSHRYNAACAAALAGCGQGDDADKLDDAERARLRRQALDWLTAELAVHTKLAEKPTAHPTVRQTMQHWQKDTDFAGIRDAAALAKVPEAERIAWEKFWTDVAELLKRTEAPTNEEKSGNKR